MNRYRARVYAGLTLLFRLPDADSLQRLRSGEIRQIRDALARLGADGRLAGTACQLETLLHKVALEELRRAYEETFEVSGEQRCVPNETAHTAETPQHALTRTFELADVAGFYRAFGVEVTPGTERADHITAELEFMHLLAVKEYLAEEEDECAEHLEICRQAARAFLRDHLGRWVERLGRQLEEKAAHPCYAAAGRLLADFVTFDSTRCGGC